MTEQPTFPPVLWTRRFEIPGTPVAWKRAKPIGRGRVIEEDDQKGQKRLIIAAASREAPPEPHDGPLFFGASFFFGVPESWSQKEKNAALRGLILPTGPPDIDNLIKIIMDALKRSKRWFRDDCRVVGIRPATFKLYSDKPGTLVQIQALQRV